MHTSNAYAYCEYVSGSAHLQDHIQHFMCILYPYDLWCFTLAPVCPCALEDSNLKSTMHSTILYVENPYMHVLVVMKTQAPKIKQSIAKSEDRKG